MLNHGWVTAATSWLVVGYHLCVWLSKRYPADSVEWLCASLVILFTREYNSLTEFCCHGTSYQAIETGFGYGEWLHGEAVAAGTVLPWLILTFYCLFGLFKVIRVEKVPTWISGYGCWHVVPPGLDWQVHCGTCSEHSKAGSVTHCPARNHDCRDV